MPFLRSSTRQQAVECFFCLSTSILPPQVKSRKGKETFGQVGTRWNWHCEKCGCWNVRDQRGEMISNVPAMHNSSLNQHSFSLRAQPSNSHLPSASTSSKVPTLFCHSCLANQTLIMNLLANYLPADDDPSFPSLNTALPDYVAGLHLRYPPVCPACQPAVDEALHKADQKSRSEVWTRALRRGAQRPEERMDRGPRWWEVWIWRLRGTLLLSGIALTMVQGVTSIFWPDLLQQSLDPHVHGVSSWHFILAFHLSSLFWTTWDPYWQRRQRCGDDFKVQGRDIWVRNMLCASAVRLGSTAMSWYSWSRRIVQMAAVVDLALVLHALICLRIAQPVRLRLVRPISLAGTPERVSSGQHHDSAPLSSLSLQERPHMPAPSPIFGQSSFQSAYPAVPFDRGDDSMDWEPAAPTSSSDWDNFGAGKQRMFPISAQETGLESLIATWGIDEGSKRSVPDGLSSKKTKGNEAGWFARFSLGNSKV